MRPALRFSDSFQSFSTAKWAYELGSGWADGREAQVYTAQNASWGTSDGLRITARREVDGSITSSRLRSVYSQRYGRFEARIRLVNPAPGVFPAVWLLGSPESSWPACGEIDLWEFFGGADGFRPLAHLHGSPDHNYGFPFDFANVADWHTYSVEWRSGYVEFKLDGQQTGYITKGAYGVGWESFANPQGIRLNVAVNTGGYTWMPPVDPSWSSSQLLVQYVKLWS